MTITELRSMLADRLEAGAEIHAENYAGSGAMTITQFRSMLADRLESESEIHAENNGRSSSHDMGEYRYNAGIAKGLLLAAIVTHDFLKED